MTDRRSFLAAAGVLALGRGARGAAPGGVVVNDVQSRLNPTRVDSVETPESLDALRSVVAGARRRGVPVCVAGGRHAMGAQQFATRGVLVDTTRLNRILRFDQERGLVEVEAGIQWPELIAGIAGRRRPGSTAWSIAQKQTGADRLALGGALASNVHGRGLRMRPIIADVESFDLLDADGALRRCSRDEDAELFRLAVGGYGLFGIITAVTLRLVPRQKLRRVVEVIDADGLIARFDERIAEGYLYGDFQYTTDERSDDFLRTGVFSCYRPVDPKTPVPERPRQLSDDDWFGLARLAHADKRRAFALYADHYKATSGQVYWSDAHQLSPYLNAYHARLDAESGARVVATEVITEIYVPRASLAGFLARVRDDFREHRVDLIYGTIRLIERDTESFLAWAKQPYACVIFNLHVEHSDDGLRRAREDFRRLIDRAIERRGSYYLTYHRFATREQVEACYPQFERFLRLKRAYDPAERFQSDWYRHHAAMFARA